MSTVREVFEYACEKKTGKDQGEIKSLLRLLQEAYPRETQRDETEDYP
jgi:hypothetical protein